MLCAAELASRNCTLAPLAPPPTILTFPNLVDIVAGGASSSCFRPQKICQTACSPHSPTILCVSVFLLEPTSLGAAVHQPYTRGGSRRVLAVVPRTLHIQQPKQGSPFSDHSKSLFNLAGLLDNVAGQKGVAKRCQSPVAMRYPIQLGGFYLDAANVLPVVGRLAVREINWVTNPAPQYAAREIFVLKELGTKRFWRTNWKRCHQVTHYIRGASCEIPNSSKPKETDNTCVKQ